MCVLYFFSSVINGVPSIDFTLTRGIRQGDPLGPFLFVICSEGLSALIKREESKYLWRGLPFEGDSLSITHLFYLLQFSRKLQRVVL